jgi:hypothetical protein
MFVHCMPEKAKAFSSSPKYAAQERVEFGSGFKQEASREQQHPIHIRPDASRPQRSNRDEQSAAFAAAKASHAGDGNRPPQNAALCEIREAGMITSQIADRLYRICPTGGVR